MKRLFDFMLSVFLLGLLSIPMISIALLVRLTSKGPAVYWSDRVGKDNCIFKMPKFRTMEMEAPSVATHLIENPESYITTIGRFLRASSLDETPQLYSILKGDMSFVGPRPALSNQDDLIKLRTKKGIDQMVPGLTGWAQVNGRDELTISEKVALDAEYLNNRSFWFDMKILWNTLQKVGSQSEVSH